MLASVQCVITLNCLNCPFNVLEHDLNECISNISVANIPNGLYNVSIDASIFTKCNENFHPPPAYDLVNVTGELFKQYLWQN